MCLNNFPSKTSNGVWCSGYFYHAMSALIWIWFYCWRDRRLFSTHNSVMGRERKDIRNKMFYPTSITILQVLPWILLPQVVWWLLQQHLRLSPLLRQILSSMPFIFRHTLATLVWKTWKRGKLAFDNINSNDAVWILFGDLLEFTCYYTILILLEISVNLNLQDFLHKLFSLIMPRTSYGDFLMSLHQSTLEEFLAKDEK